MEASSAPAPATPAGQRASLTHYRVFTTRDELIEEPVENAVPVGSPRDLLWIGDCQARNRDDAGETVIDEYDPKDLPPNAEHEAARERIKQLAERLDRGEAIGLQVAPLSAIGGVVLEAVVERKLKVKR